MLQLTASWMVLRCVSPWNNFTWAPCLRSCSCIETTLVAPSHMWLGRSHIVKLAWTPFRLLRVNKACWMSRDLKLFADDGRSTELTKTNCIMGMIMFCAAASCCFQHRLRLPTPLMPRSLGLFISVMPPLLHSTLSCSKNFKLHTPFTQDASCDLRTRCYMVTTLQH